MHFVILLYALFGSLFVIAKHGLQYVQPFFLIGFRMMLGGILLLAYQWWKDAGSLKIPRSLWMKLFLLGLFNIYLTNALEFWGLQYLSSSKTSFIYSFSPFFAAILSYFIIGEKMTLKKWTGLTIGFLGFLPLLLYESFAEQSLGGIGFVSWAELSVMGAALSTVIGWILMKDLVSNSSLSFFTANGFSMLIGGVLALLNSYAVENWDPIPTTDIGIFLKTSLYMMVVSNFICYNMYGWLLKRFSTTFMSFAGFSTPFITALFGWVFLGEEATVSLFVSGLIVGFGLTLFYQEELSKEGIAVKA